jgi:antitoxin component YwqK of YwqJK toxin-antitoxin module/Tfp pilus assembly protein PilF
MRRAFLSICLLFTVFFQLYAQRELSNPLIDSKEIIAKGVALHDSGNYKAAINEYIKVSSSDTSYALVLHELILSCYRDSNFVDAERYANTALELYPDQKTEWYGLLANIYDDTKRTDLTLKMYDTILAQEPYSYLTYFNKGITLYRQLRYDEAMVNLQQCIILNPYYPSAHYFLGQLAMMRGNMVQAMMSFATALLVVPNTRYQKNIISFLNTIAGVSTLANEYLQKYKPGKEDNFEDVQDILVSKVALDNKYKLKADLEDQIVRQLQVVIEKLEYNANDKGFWMQYYVPLYKNLWNNNQFEPLIFYMFSGLDVKKIKEYNQKEKKKIEAFSTAATGYLDNLRESHELYYDKREKAQPKYYISNYLVTGKGDYGKNSKNENVVTGPWEFYFTNGRVKSKGNFNSGGLRDGLWHYYYENGLLKEETEYSADVPNGKSKSWFDNGLPYTITTYNRDVTEGEKTTYFFNGRLLSVINYKAGKKGGVAKYYNVDGYLRTVDNYSNDKQEGDETIYNSHENIESVVKYANDLPVGEYKEYYTNGKLKTKGNYEDGKKAGVWNSYFKEGNLEQMENYSNGKLDGELVSYYPDNKVKSKSVYKKGEIDGKKEEFDDDGILFCETIFEKGRLRDIKFLDKTGAVISNTTSRKGNADISFYGPDGAKTGQGYYTKDGEAEGKYTYYYKNGQISGEGLYKNDELDGKKTSYYVNGKMSEEGNYKGGKAHGYFVNYYNNGQVSGEGWYVDDQRQGTFINYDLLGKAISKIYYLDDKVHGISDYYTPSGKQDYKEYYDNGWFNKIEQFDSTGKIMVSSKLNKGEGKVRFNHFNGRPYFESNYKYYKLNGVYTVTNGDGSKNSVLYYKNGVHDSVYTAWYPNGKVQVEGKYVDGNKTGAWKYYSYNGKLYETELYVDGKLDGADIQYNEQGMVERVDTFKNGEQNGESRLYGDNDELRLVFYNKNDNALGYSYEDKTGKLVPMIPIVKGSGVIDGYYKNGNKSVHMVLNEGLLHGERIIYSTNGKEQSVGSRVNGVENGIRKTYYVSGEIMKEESFYYGKLHGPDRYYSEDGSLIYELNYYLGSLNGDCKFYTAGKLSQTYNYYYGSLESKK